MAATVKTTFTFNSTDIASDTLSFSVSETLNLTGSGGIERIDLAAASGSGSSFRVYQENDFGATTPTYLYLKNITGSGYSASAGYASTASVVHIIQTGSAEGFHGLTEKPNHPFARVTMGNFCYIPLNPSSSYDIFTGDMTSNEQHLNAQSTIVEYGVFN